MVLPAPSYHELEDKFENTGAQMLREVASKLPPPPPPPWQPASLSCLGTPLPRLRGRGFPSSLGVWELWMACAST